jgi:hypothetical protein
MTRLVGNASAGAYLAYLRAVHGGRLRDNIAGWWALPRELVRWGWQATGGKERDV